MVYYCTLNYPAAYKVININPTFTSRNIKMKHTLMHQYL